MRIGIAAALLTMFMVSVPCAVITFTDATDTAFDGMLPLDGLSVSIGDVDGDGDLDIWNFNDGDIDDKLYRNDGSAHFEDITAEAGVAGTPGGGPEFQGPFADFENDGDPDAYVATSLNANQSENYFYRNLDGLHYAEVGVSLGVGNTIDTIGAAWADIDGDRFLDFIAASLARPGLENKPLLFVSQQAQSFTDEAVSRGIDTLVSGYPMLWFDWEDDGDSDLYFGVYHALSPADREDLLYRNDGTGHFSLTTAAINPSPEVTTGLQLADFDGDARLDLFVLNERVVNQIWRDNGDSTFTDIATTLGLEMDPPVVNGNPERKSSLVVADFDNDMDLDVFVTWTDATVGGEPPDQLWLNEGGTYVERGAEAGVIGIGTTPVNAWACAAGDLNGDGFLDLYVVNDNMFGTRDTLFLNNGNSNHWLIIDPEGLESNRDAFGLRAWVTAGGVTQVQELYCSPSHPSRLHFGLASNEIVSEVRLRWPCGLEETYTDLLADQVFCPLEGASLSWGDRVGVIFR